MERLSERKIIIIHRETRLDGLIRRHNTLEQAGFYINSRGDNFNDYLDEDRELKLAISNIERALRAYGRVQRLERDFLPSFLFGPDDIVVIAGQDGLVVNALKYLNGLPLIAINPAPQRFDGELLPFKYQNLETVLKAVLNNRFPTKAITMAQAELNDGQTLLAVNDFYIGPKLPISARYELEYNGKREVQTSSGVLVSTGLGSTGWLRSLITGAAALVQSPAQPKFEMPWSSPDLYFCVREPLPSQTTGTSLVFGRIEPSQHFSLRSQMPEGGIIFSDGIVDDSIEFNSGTIANIAIAKVKGQLVTH